MEKNTFLFKKFLIRQNKGSMKVNTDGILLGAWADIGSSNRVLDIGTGTGVIALMLAQKNPDLKIDAIDIDIDSFQQALENFSGNEIGKNIKAHLTSFQEFSKQGSKKNFYDFIVSNPPFFSGGIFSDNTQRAKARHTIDLGHEDLLQGVRQMLKMDGFFALILPQKEGVHFIQLAEKCGFFLVEKIEVYTRNYKNIERLLLKFSLKNHHSNLVSSLVIMNGNTDEYSYEFKCLTKDFYLHL